MYRILLVEDDEQIREVITDYFSAQNDAPVIETAADGNAGLECICENEYDLIMLDVMLPGIDGYSLCREIRSKSIVPVLFLTARGRENDILYGYSLGCDDYIVKPFSLAELYAKTTAMLKRASGMIMTSDLICGKISLNPVSQIVTVEGNSVELAPKEYALLKYLIEHKNFYLVNYGDKKTGISEVYKADEKAAEKLLVIREKYPDSVIKIHAAYTGEDGKFIPENAEVKTGDIISETVDFSDIDKKDYKYTELNERTSRLDFMMFNDFSGNIPELSERILSESDLVITDDTIINFLIPRPLYKRINIYIGNNKYFLYYGTEEAGLFNTFGTPERIVFLLIPLLAITLVCSLIWSWEKYRELKVHYDTEDFRKELTNTMAHDLKSPLMAASGYAENLLNRTNPEKNDHYAQALLENINYMDTIITDVLELSKLESGSEILNRTSVSFRTLAEEIVKKSEDIISERSLSVNVTGECQAEADRSLMKRAIENLILNAAKYADEGSEIKVILSKTGITVENRYSGVEITDTDSLMEPFVKGDRSRSSRKGSGLGLSIVKNITDMHGFRFNISAADNVFRSEIRLKK